MSVSPKEQLAQWMIENSFATGHGDTMADMLAELKWQIEDRVTAARHEGYADGRLDTENSSVDVCLASYTNMPEAHRWTLDTADRIERCVKCGERRDA